MQKKRNTRKKGKDQKKRVPVSPALYHGIFMLKSNVDTSIELDTIMCASNISVIFRMRKVCKQKIRKRDSGMGQHGQRLITRELVFLSSDDKLVLFLFPGIPTGDPAIVAFYDKRIYKKKLRLR
jgi:hypothetical protein